MVQYSRAYTLRFLSDKKLSEKLLVLYSSTSPLQPSPLPLSQWERGRGEAEGRGVRVR